MKVYLTPPQHSLGLERIATALRRYAPPWVQVSTFPRNVDLTVIYAIGRRDAVQRQCEDILKRGKKYAIVQCCLRSTMAPDSRDWIDIWQGAKVVWSYYDLEQALANDFDDDEAYFNALRTIYFYHTPLGADAEVFFRDSIRDFYSAKFYGDNSKFIIVTSGLSRLSESVRECILAAKEVNRSVLHLGPQTEDRMGENVRCINGVRDEVLAHNYSNCEFVSGLRRKEGFELPAIEGLLCGARPIVFDTPDYRWNYGDHAEYIHEGSREEVVEQLVKLFRQGARPVSAEERERAVERYNWKTIIGGFYERCG